MNATLTLVNEKDTVLPYLDEARKHHAQAAIAKYFDIEVRAVRRWVNKTTPSVHLPQILG